MTGLVLGSGLGPLAEAVTVEREVSFAEAGLPVSSVPGHAGKFLFGHLEGEAVILNLDSGVYYTLDPVGTRIWQLIEEHGDLAKIKESMLAEYEVQAEELDSDLIRLVDELVESGLLAQTAPAEGS